MGEEALGKKLEFGGDKITGSKCSGREKNLWAYTFLPFSHQTPIGQTPLEARWQGTRKHSL